MEHLNVTNIIITSQIYHTLKKKGKAKNSYGAYFAKKQPEWNLQMFFSCSLKQCVPVRWPKRIMNTHTFIHDATRSKAEPDHSSLLGICWCAKKSQVHKQQKPKDASHLLLLKQNNSQPLQVTQILLRSTVDQPTQH